mgnify:CR=1 FL=1
MDAKQTALQEKLAEIHRRAAAVGAKIQAIEQGVGQRLNVQVQCPQALPEKLAVGSFFDPPCFAGRAKQVVGTAYSGRELRITRR